MEDILISLKKEYTCHDTTHLFSINCEIISGGGYIFPNSYLEKR